MVQQEIEPRVNTKFYGFRKTIAPNIFSLSLLGYQACVCLCCVSYKTCSQHCRPIHFCIIQLSSEADFLTFAKRFFQPFDHPFHSKRHTESRKKESSMNGEVFYSINLFIILLYFCIIRRTFYLTEKEFFFTH